MEKARSAIEVFRTKAQAMSLVALEDAYDHVIDQDTPLKLKLEFVDLCTKLADFQPKVNQTLLPGGHGMSVVINLGTQDAPKTLTIDAGESLPADGGGPQLPESIRAYVSEMNSALSYEEAA